MKPGGGAVPMEPSFAAVPQRAESPRIRSPKEHTLDISHNVKRQATSGVAFRLTNRSEHHGVLVAGMSLYGNGKGHLRVLVVRDLGKQSSATYWDWRSYVQLLDLPEEELSFTSPTRLHFCTAVPLEPTQTAHFYIYSDAFRVSQAKLSDEFMFGVAYRKFRQVECAADECMACRMCEGHRGGTSSRDGCGRRAHTRNLSPLLLAAQRAEACGSAQNGAERSCAVEAYATPIPAGLIMTHAALPYPPPAARSAALARQCRRHRRLWVFAQLDGTVSPRRRRSLLA